MRRSEFFKSLATFLVPVISILTVLVSLLTQREQTILSRQQDEDKQWRDFLATVRANFSNATGTLAFDPTLPAQIKSFLHSTTYRDQATDLAKRLAGHLANQTSFEELLNVAFPSDSNATLSDLSDLNKAVTRSQRSLTSLCSVASAKFKLPATNGAGICDNFAVPDDDVQKYVAAEQLNSINILRAQYSAANDELYTTSDRLAQWIRNKNYDGGDAEHVKLKELSGVFLYAASLGGATIINVDLSNTTFDSVDLSGVNISSSSGRIGGAWGSDWWDAARIDSATLDFLIDSFYPGYTREYLAYPGFQRGVPSSAHKVITGDEFRQKVFVLCHEAKADCYSRDLKFNKDNIAGLTQ